MQVVLISTYDLGRQPFGVASAEAWLRRAGVDVSACDLSRDELDHEAVRRADVVAFYLPMHTATRLAVPVIDRVRAMNPAVTVCAYGLYAPLSQPLLQAHGVSAILGPEAEEDLVALATGALGSAADHGHDTGRTALPRLAFIRPYRQSLPALARYATLQMPDGSCRVAGATDATRGCKHRCRHCPIVPVYDGRFRVVPLDVVMADIDQQVAAGAEHITFGDPDFFNGPAHARRVIEALHERHPRVSYDATIKVEHLLTHGELLPALAATGCAFVTTAVESIDDDILRRLDKGHSRADFLEAVRMCRDAGVVLAPTFVAFTPWTTIEGYRELLETIDALDLVEHVAPVQWGLRLLVTHGSRLLELPDLGRRVDDFDPGTLTYPWVHDDPAVDALQRDVLRAVGVRLNRPRREVFDEIGALAGAQLSSPRRSPAPARSTIPYLNEPWYC